MILRSLCAYYNICQRIKLLANLVLNRIAGVDETCDFVKADFMKMPFPDNSFDAVYAIAATCHAPDAVGCYKEIYRVLKPGQCFAANEWCMTDAFDPDNEEHRKIKAEIELGNGLPDVRLTRQCLEALKQAGFQVVLEKDLAVDSPLSWYLPLDKSQFSLSNFRSTAVGRFITKYMVMALEKVGVAPKGSQRVQAFLEKASDGLVAGGNSTAVTGLNNNEYQIERGKVLNRIAGVDETCDFVKADFMKMPFPDNSFDAVYAIAATCHAPDAVECYKEIYRVLKPGQCFAANEWCMTDAFDPDNEEHRKIKAEIELGNGLPDVRLTRQCLEALKQAGFEVVSEKDLAVDSPLSWYLPLDKSQFSLNNFRSTAVGRFITKYTVMALEKVGVAPKGSQRVQAFLEKASDGLVAGGKKEIFTAVYFFLARKPHLDD
ncbi:unnamed protein product [Fraxinus pennsylvanica]|uniref:Methyltransferase n=1 Tax=Fraxinus pennsylvanica TaxID=56036 RepID=A0AAD1ZDG5_9LAMI|nr:unnamed protein product [Fraxinus pennsylvanica]